MPVTDLPGDKVGGGGGAVSKKNFFQPFGPQFGLKKGGVQGPWASPLDLPQQMHHTGLQ